MHQSAGGLGSQMEGEAAGRGSSAGALQRGKACINCRRRKMVSSSSASTLPVINASRRDATEPSLCVGLAQGRIEVKIASIRMPKVVRVHRC